MNWSFVAFFRFGQGGMILLSATLREPTAFDGVVFMGPLIHIDPALASPVKLWAARLFSRLTPQLTVSSHIPLLIQSQLIIDIALFAFQVGSLNMDHVTSDEAMREDIKNDPLIYKGGIKCKWVRLLSQLTFHKFLPFSLYGSIG